MMNLAVANENRTIINDPTFRLTASRLVIKCGVHANLKGFQYLTDAVILYGTEVSTKTCEIYNIIGEIYGLNYKTVMREISYAIKQTNDIAERLSELVGTKFSKNEIHNGLVIANLGILFRNPNFNVYS